VQTINSSVRLSSSRDKMSQAEISFYIFNNLPDNFEYIGDFMSISLKGYQSTKTKQERILSQLAKMKKASANQIIDALYKDDLENLNSEEKLERSWRYYVHLNKQLAPLEKKNKIKFTGEMTVGDLGRPEKLWELY
jgi:hypothetical protein